jgi:hypothetical protein
MAARAGEQDGDENRCTATAKGTGERCRRWAVSGFNVCVVHGVGTRKRRKKAPRDGRLRKDPTTARFVHGLYASRVPRTINAAAAAYEAAGEELYRLDAVAARLWVLLEQCDRMAEAARRDAKGNATPSSVAALLAVERVLNQIQRVIALRHRLDPSQREMITQGDLLGVLRIVSASVEELALDESVPREDFRARLVDLVMTRAGLHVATPDAGPPARLQ